MVRERLNMDIRKQLSAWEELAFLHYSLQDQLMILKCLGCCPSWLVNDVVVQLALFC